MVRNTLVTDVKLAARTFVRAWTEFSCAVRRGGMMMIKMTMMVILMMMVIRMVMIIRIMMAISSWLCAPLFVRGPSFRVW